MPPSTVLWQIDEHTIGKHLVLRNYLNAWFPILGLTQRRILFIDGFSGPGEYEGGEEGSPLVAMRALREHHASGRFRAKVVFRFIEADPRRAQHLRGLVEHWSQTLPAGTDVQAINGVFDEQMTASLDRLQEQGARLAPAFVMLDPFGVSGIPFSLVERILSYDKAEIYVTLMYDFIGRFRGASEFELRMDELFGCEEWRDGVDIADDAERRQFYLSLYENQLRQAGATNVVRFDLYQGQRHVYSIFFGTKHWMGADRMKQAIWRVAPFGDYAFRAGRRGQLTLGLAPAAIDYTPLVEQLIDYFGDGRVVGISEVKEFVGSDRTQFHTAHLLRPVLAPMEKNGQIEVVSSSRKKKGAFPKGTKLRFIKNPSSKW